MPGELAMHAPIASRPVGGSQCLQMTEATLEAGRALYRSCLRRFQECEAADVWPGVAPDLQDWDLPAWAATGEPEPEEETF